MGRVFEGRQADAAFRRKGFIRDISGDHFWYLFPNQNGLGILTQTKISHGMMGSTLSASLINKMARQLHLTKNQFLDFIDCRMSEKEYRTLAERI
jgi:hypothetical protein